MNRPEGSAPGASVVAVGGGHGLAASLRAVRQYAESITAIVSVADDGGSSGRLRERMPDLPAPGDIRRCLSAMADPATDLADVLEHRFGPGAGDLSGHAFGNLLLTALSFGLGSFGAAVDEVARLAGVDARILPATDGPVDLRATVAANDGGPDRVVVGQVAVANTVGIGRISIRPAGAGSSSEVTDAILHADQVVLGPGSLFTSVLATAVVPAVNAALSATPAQRVYVANLRPQKGETEGFDLGDHLRALDDHGVRADVVICHPGVAGIDAAADTNVVIREVADHRDLVHSPDRLAKALAEVLRER